jgi:outer membrane protein assembly factor BamE (lipoprotein component of BamABCDE complex)
MRDVSFPKKPALSAGGEIPNLRLGVVLAAVAAVVTFLCAGLVWVAEADPIPAARVAQMHKGMDRGEVRSLLGKPNSAVVDEDGSEIWLYQRYTVKVFIVRFSSAGEVTGFNSDN